MEKYVKKCSRCSNKYCNDKCKGKIHNFKGNFICYKCVENKGKSEFHNPEFCIICYKKGHGKIEEIKECKLCEVSYCRKCQNITNKFKIKKNIGLVCKFCIYRYFSEEYSTPEEIFYCDVKGCKNSNSEYFFRYKKFKRLQKICSDHKICEELIFETELIKYCNIMKQYYPVNFTKNCISCNRYFYKKLIKKEQCITCYLACIKIQKWWFNIYWDPKSHIRKKILNSQYDKYYN